MNFMVQTRARRMIAYLLTILAGIVVSTSILIGIILISNRNLPRPEITTDHMLTIDKIRLQETLHQRDELGEQIWPGFSELAIPIIIWNEEYEFLFGVENPPVDWEIVPDESFRGQPYYRKSAVNPQNFIVQVGEQQACSMFSKYQLDRELITALQDRLPPSLVPFFPYRLMIQPSELQMASIQHECFHVFQAITVPEKFAAAQGTYSAEDRYWAIDPDMQAAWSAEVVALQKAVNAQTIEATEKWTGQFLSLRDQRRTDHQLDARLVAYERLVEWLEGTAKYVELRSWQAAATDPTYEPIAGMEDDPDFKGYETYESHWDREVSLAKQQTSREGDLRFYYSGLLQAAILDRLMPDWKERVMTQGVFLEDLLREAIQFAEEQS
jgi:hypothetical protein